MTAKPKTAKPMGLIQRSWKLALEFGLGYPIGKSEREKLLPRSHVDPGFLWRVRSGARVNNKKGESRERTRRIRSS